MRLYYKNDSPKKQYGYSFLCTNSYWLNYKNLSNVLKKNKIKDENMIGHVSVVKRYHKLHHCILFSNYYSNYY